LPLQQQRRIRTSESVQRQSALAAQPVDDETSRPELLAGVQASEERITSAAGAIATVGVDSAITPSI
jgi:uncharacterized protein with PhoU and TrkA domain